MPEQSLLASESYRNTILAYAENDNIIAGQSQHNGYWLTRQQRNNI